MPATIPLVDLPRQSLIIRLNEIDCGITVWWQPSDSSWWAGLEVPVGTPAVRSRRLALNAGILDRIDGILPGNIVCRGLGTEEEPGRNAWRVPTHALRWEEDEEVAETISPVHSQVEIPVDEPGTAVSIGSATGRDGSVYLIWTPVDGAARYQIQWKSGTQPFSGQRTLFSEFARATVENLTAGTSYDFRVRALNATMPGAWSSVVLATPT